MIILLSNFKNDDSTNELRNEGCLCQGFCKAVPENFNLLGVVPFFSSSISELTEIIMIYLEYLLETSF